MKSTILFLILPASLFGQAGWTQLANTTLTSVCPSSGTQGDCTGVIETWSGGAADIARTRMLLWGGGHGNYNGNEVYAIYPPGTTLPSSPAVCSSATAPAICRIKNPSASLRAINDTSGPYGGCWYTEPNGTEPNSRHSYAGMAYLSWADKMFAHNGSLACANGGKAGDSWLLDLASLTWTTKDPANGSGLLPHSICTGCGSTGQGPQGMVIADPSRQLVYVFSSIYASTTGANMWTWNPATNTFATVANNIPTAFNANWVFDPKRHKIFSFGNNTNGGIGNATTQMGTPQIISVDVSSGGSYAFTDVSNTATTCDGLSGSINPGLTYWNTLDRIVGWPNFGNTIYVYNPDTNRCTAETYSGGPPDSRNAGNQVETTGTFGRLQYFPALDAALIANDGNTNAYMLRLSSNLITITEEDGSTKTNYPVQVGRAFLQGEIQTGQSPQAFVSGSAVNTQVDVKNVYSDGSLKFAIISFLIPTLTASTSVEVSFRSGSTVGNTALTKATMLGVPYNFDAGFSLTKTPTTKTASGRTMLTNDDYTVWTSGPIVTTILLGNDAQGTTCGGNAASAYDFGFDSFCAFRPKVEAQFWATGTKVKVRFIGELANTTQLEDVVINSMTLTTGNSSPTTVYTLPGGKSPLTMSGGSRWTKKGYWINTDPGKVSINPNLAYLAAAKAVPNYDTSKTVSGATLTSTYAAYIATDRDLYGSGDWLSNGVCCNLTSGGGHSWIGPVPAWIGRWLYTGDWRMAEESLGDADLFGAFPIHFREGTSGKFINQGLSVSGLGHVMSVSSRVALSWAASTGIYIGGASNNGSAVVSVGTFSNSNFIVDPAHSPQLGIEYLLTGDHYYLEESWFLAGWLTWWGNNDGTVGSDGTWRSRGPTGKEGNLPNQAGRSYQVRGQGWAFLDRARAGYLSPDSSAEKGYFDQLNNDVIAYWEGQRAITSTSFNGNAMWTYGNNTATVSGTNNNYWIVYDSTSTDYLVGIPPLHWWDTGAVQLCDAPNNMSVTHSCTRMWFQDYVVTALSVAKELGYSTNALLAWMAPNMISQINDSGYNPFIAGAYATGTSNQVGTPANFSTWAATKNSFNSNVQTETDFYPGAIFMGQQSDPDGNVQPFSQAISSVTDQSGGTTAWGWVAANIGTAISQDMRWSAQPRGAPGTIAPAVSTPTITTTCPLTAGTTTVAYSVQFTVTGGTPPLVWSASGTLPPGLSFSAAGLLDGTPVSSGTFTPTFTVTDALAQADSKINCSITIGTASPGITMSGKVSLSGNAELK